jgi:hypothetical protein
MDKDFSKLSVAELSKLLSDNKVKGRASATTKAQKVQLLNDFFGIVPTLERTQSQAPARGRSPTMPLLERSPSPRPIKRSPSPKPIKRSPSPRPIKRSPSPKPIKRSPSPKPIKRSPSPSRRAGIKPVNDILIDDGLISRIHPYDGIILLSRIYFQNTNPDKNLKKEIETLTSMKKFEEQKRSVQDQLKKYLGLKIYDIAATRVPAVFYSPEPRRYSAVDFKSINNVYTKLSQLTLPELNITLRQFDIPNEQSINLKDKKSMVKFIADTIEEKYNPKY